MNQMLAFHSIILITVAILILNVENYQNINADRDSNNRDNSTDSSSLFLPFTSHIADQSINEKEYSSNIIPFP